MIHTDIINNAFIAQMLVNICIIIFLAILSYRIYSIYIMLINKIDRISKTEIKLENLEKRIDIIAKDVKTLEYEMNTHLRIH